MGKISDLIESANVARRSNCGSTRSQCSTHADLAAGLPALSARALSPKLTCSQSDATIGNHTPEDACRMEAAWRRNPERSSRSRQHGLAGISAADAAGTGSICSTAISAPCRSFGRPCWNCSKNSPCAQPDLARRKCGLLELVAAGNSLPIALFYLRVQQAQQRRVFDYWEVGSLLEGLAHGPAPAVAGLDEGLRSRKKWTRTRPSREHTSKASYRSPRSAEAVLSRRPRISAGTTRSTAGGAGPN